MICENCKQRPATVTVTHTKNGEQTVNHFCEVCSEQGHYTNDKGSDTPSIAQLFSSWFGTPTWSMDAPASPQKTQHTMQCTVCQMTYKQFLQTGKFNCPNCYEAFSESLPSVFKRLHNGAEEHVGKVPSGLNEAYKIKKEIELLRGAMREAIQNENFEEAATIRDTIYELQEQLKQGGVTEE